MADQFDQYKRSASGDNFDQYKVKAAQSDPNNTGIVGPDQTAPNAGLAPPAGAPKSAPMKEWEGGIFSTDPTMINSGPHFGEKNPDYHPMPGTGEGANLADNLGEYTTATGGRAIDGGYDIARGNIKKGLHKEVQAAGNALAPTLAPMAVAAPIPTAISLALGYGGGKAGREIANLSGGDEDTQNLSEDAGNIIGGMGIVKAFGKPKAKALDQEKAFNVLHPDNAVADSSILPEIRNAAAKNAAANPANPILSRLGANPKVNVPRGKAGVDKLPDIIQQGIADHEAQVQSVKAPFQNAPQSNAAAAAAARSKITPEMRLISVIDPTVANQVSQIEAIAQRAEGANTVGLTDQLRHSWNDDLASELSKTAARQDVSPAATQAKVVAANALRNSFYENLSNLSGEDVRPLAQREGQLIEAKAGAVKSGETALKNKGNDKSFIGRVLTGSDRDAGGVSSVVPAKASVAEIPVNIIRALRNKDFGTPVGDYNARIQRSLADLPTPKNFDPYQAVPPVIRGFLGKGATITPPPADTSGSIAFEPPPVASTTRTQRLGVTPPNANGTIEHVPYNAQANSSNLSNAVRVPKQLGGAGPNGQRLLPSSTGGAIDLPAKSQSTLVGSRTFESPASNEGVVPALIRSMIEGKSVTGQVIPPMIQDIMGREPLTNTVNLPKTVSSDINLRSNGSPAPVSNKIGGAKVLAGDIPLTGPVSPVAADITRLKAELKTATDPKEIADIQQALEHAQARMEGRPFTPPEQAAVENLPAVQPRDIDPGTYNRETKVHTPGKTPKGRR